MYEEAKRRIEKLRRFSILYGIDFGMDKGSLTRVLQQYPNERRNVMDEEMNNRERMGRPTRVNEVRDDRAERIEPPILEPALTTNAPARAIMIRPMSYGYVVEIGCQSFAIESHTKLVAALEKYLAEPQKTEKAWLAGEFDLKNMK